jgi:hypothetical protein
VPEGAAYFIAKVQKMENGSSLMEWIRIMVRSSSGSSSTKHKATGSPRRRGGNSTAIGFGI